MCTWKECLPASHLILSATMWGGTLRAFPTKETETQGVFHSLRQPVSEGAGISSWVLITPRTSQYFTLIDLFPFPNSQMSDLSVLVTP